MYHIFISHAWKYDSDYSTIVSWLKDSDLIYSNYSVPYHDPLDANNTKKLKTALTNQISPSNIVLVIAGMYDAYSDWIKYEIDEAVRMGKTIIGIKPWGHQRVPEVVTKNATEMVNWNSKSLIEAIKKH